MSRSLSMPLSLFTSISLSRFPLSLLLIALILSSSCSSCPTIIILFILIHIPSPLHPFLTLSLIPCLSSSFFLIPSLPPSLPPPIFFDLPHSLPLIFILPHSLPLCLPPSLLLHPLGALVLHHKLHHGCSVPHRHDRHDIPKSPQEGHRTL